MGVEKSAPLFNPKLKLGTEKSTYINIKFVAEVVKNTYVYIWNLVFEWIPNDKGTQPEICRLLTQFHKARLDEPKNPPMSTKAHGVDILKKKPPEGPTKTKNRYRKRVNKNRK